MVETDQIVDPKDPLGLRKALAEKKSQPQTEDSDPLGLKAELLKKKDLTVNATNSSDGSTQAGSDASQEPGVKEQQPSEKSTQGEIEPPNKMEMIQGVLDAFSPATPLSPGAASLFDLGRKAISVVKDQIPAAIAGEQAIQKRTNYLDELRRTQPEKYEVSNEFASEATRIKYAEAQAKRILGEQGYEKKKNEYAKTSMAEKQSLLDELKTQRQEEADFTKGIPSTFEEAKQKGKIASFIGGAIGNGLGQIPASIATLGASSYFMEKTDAYDQSLEAIAKSNGITPKEVVEQNMDGPAKEVAHTIGLVNGAIDLGSSLLTVAKGFGQGIKSIIKKNAQEQILKDLPEKIVKESLLKKGVKEAAAPLTEYGTEFLQAFNTQVGALTATGKNISDINLNDISKGGDIDWSSAHEEGLQGMIGSGGIIVGGKVISNIKSTPQVIQEARAVPTSTDQTEVINAQADKIIEAATKPDIIEPNNTPNENQNENPGDSTQQLPSGSKQEGSGSQQENAEAITRAVSEAGSNVTGSQRSTREVKKEQDLKLEESARENGTFIEDVRQEFGEKLDGGTEQDVYESKDGNKVIKVNGLSNHSSWAEFLNRLDLQNKLFPNTGYKLIGFTKEGGRLSAVIEQPFVDGTPVQRQELVEDLAKRGFYQIHPDGSLGENQFYNSELGIRLTDVHEENVKKDADGNIRYIDPMLDNENPFVDEQSQKHFNEQKTKLLPQIPNATEGQNQTDAIDEQETNGQGRKESLLTKPKEVDATQPLSNEPITVGTNYQKVNNEWQVKQADGTWIPVISKNPNKTKQQESSELAQMKDLMAQLEQEEPQNLKMSTTEKGRIAQLEPSSGRGAVRKFFWDGGKILWETKDKRSSIPRKGIKDESGIREGEKANLKQHIDDTNGLTPDEISERLTEQYGFDVSKQDVIDVLAHSDSKNWYADQKMTEDPEYLMGAEERYNSKNELASRIAELETDDAGIKETNKQLYENERRVNQGESAEGFRAGELQNTGEQGQVREGEQRQEDASQSIRENGDETKSQQALAELNSLTLTHVPGLGMGQNQAKGTYLSTEKENRYATEEKKPVTVKVKIKNPFVSIGNVFYDIQRKIIQARFGKNSIDDITETEADLLAEMVNEHFVNEGYDAIYFPESDSQEGEVVVFDRKNVVFPGEENRSKETQPSKTKGILQRILDSDVRASIKKGLKEKGVTYVPKGLDLTYSEAKDLVEFYGDKADLIVRDLSNGLTPDTRTAMTAILYEQYVAEKRNEEAIDIAMWQAEQSLQAGRAGNAAKIWKMITQSGEDNIVLAIEKEQQKTIEQAAAPVREELTKSMEDIDAEIRKQVEARVQNEVESRLKKAKLITKEKRKEIADFFDGLKVDTSNKGTLNSSVIPGLTLLPHVWNASVDIMKQAILTGADVANAIQAGIDYIKANQEEPIDEEKFKEFMTPKLQAIVPKEPINREQIDDDKISVPKKIASKKKEFIDKAIDAYNKGKLTDKKLDEIYAGRVGVKTITEQERNQIRELAQIIDRAEKFEKEVRENFTPENIAKYKELLREAQKANNLLNEIAAKPSAIEDTLISIMQGNLMSTMSLVSNIFYNVSYQPLRFLSTGIASMTDYSISKLAKLGILDEAYKDRTIDFAALQKGYYKGAWNGLIEGARQLKTGQEVDARTLREVQSNFNPARAIQRWTDKDRSLSQKANDYIEGTLGWEAEIIFRLLNFGDKPWRRAAEFARTYEMAEKKGLKGKELQKFMLLPDPDSAAEIKQAGDEATFQQQGEWAKMLQGGLANLLNKIAEIPYIGKPAKILLKSQFPFIKTPWNLVAETIQYAAPPITMAIGMRQIANGDRRNGNMLVGKAMVGFMIQAVAYELFLKGIMTGDDDKEEKKRNFQLQNTPPSNSINTSAINRGLSGGSWEPKDKDTWVSYQKMGVIGVLFDSYSNTYKERQNAGEPIMTTETYLYDMFTSGPKVASSSLDQTFLQGTSTLLEAVKDGGNKKTQNWLIKTSEAVGAIAYPNIIATTSKAYDEYLRDVKDDDFFKRLTDTYKAKMFMGDELPAKVSIWGDKVTGAPEGRSKVMFYMFDPSKFRNIGTDDFRYKLYTEFKKDGDADWLPGAPSRELSVDGEKVKLSTKQYELLSIYVGKERADMTQSFINSEEWESSSTEEKKEELKYIYRTAGETGKARMMIDMGYNTMKIKDIVKSASMEKFQRKMSKMAKKLSPDY